MRKNEVHGCYRTCLISQRKYHQQPSNPGQAPESLLPVTGLFCQPNGFSSEQIILKEPPILSLFFYQSPILSLPPSENPFATFVSKIKGEIFQKSVIRSFFKDVTSGL